MYHVYSVVAIDIFLGRPNILIQGLGINEYFYQIKSNKTYYYTFIICIYFKL